MPFEMLDLILGGIMLLSGLLALTRGFTREVLSLISWGLAAGAGLFAAFNDDLVAFALDYVQSDTIARVAVGGGVFLIVLIILSIISVPTGCARNAACSASSATPTPPPSPRSACTRCSTAARRPPASSASTAPVPFRAPPRPGRRPLLQGIDHRPPARHSAIGHVRYSTTGETVLRNVQPLFAELDPAASPSATTATSPTG
jgi:hypothetical protein